jgi:hypothetical protein
MDTFTPSEETMAETPDPELSAAESVVADALNKSLAAAAKKERDPLYCSFCGKSQHEVKRLVAGATSLICNECVELCTEIFREEEQAGRPKSLTEGLALSERLTAGDIDRQQAFVTGFVGDDALVSEMNGRIVLTPSGCEPLMLLTPEAVTYLVEGRAARKGTTS